jgi:hypothetical protein
MNFLFPNGGLLFTFELFTYSPDGTTDKNIEENGVSGGDEPNETSTVLLPR